MSEEGERGILSCRADAKWGYLAAKKIDVDQLSHSSAVATADMEYPWRRRTTQEFESKLKRERERDIVVVLVRI